MAMGGPVNRGTKIGTLLAIEEHKFRDKKMCSSPSYQKAMEEATAEMATLITLSADEQNKLEAQGLFTRPPGIHGFFYVAPALGCYPRNVTAAPNSGHLEFRHASKRYKDGWDSGKDEADTRG
jgi:hypothetical protein